MSVEVDPSCLDALREVGEVDVVAPDRGYLLDHIQEYDAYLPTLSIRFDREMAERASKGRLRLIYTPSTGLDHLDLEALEEFGIEMHCIRTEFGLLDQITSTAELAFTLMLSVVRKVPAGHNAVMMGRWARDFFRGNQLAGKTLGVLGVGRLGGMMVDYGRGFRMKVIGCDHNPRRRIPNLAYLPFDEFSARADVISIHIHLTPENEHFLDAERLGMMKNGVVLINTSRGKIIDEEALLVALNSGKVGGFGADVIVGEWRDDLEQHPLIAYSRDHDHVTILPHVGGITWEAQRMAYRFVAGKMVEIIRGWEGRSATV